MLIYLLIVVIIGLAITNFIAINKASKYRDELYAQTDMYNYYKNKISMIEYHYRNYTEGKNAFTVLRKIGDIIQDYYLKLGANKGDYDE